jgi:hypothetical protein
MALYGLRELVCKKCCPQQIIYIYIYAAKIIFENGENYYLSDSNDRVSDRVIILHFVYFIQTDYINKFK